eukprot:CAMPEP_0204373516 /NCGR_PEP_ID=MMETSP0469-20131031/48094_1 /ASSEMBLY_ACC=CAM_ASM_000384 /TAXON_ID=2969 /ORGANISM="Oxyrrhis marina" /LENGTH=534 /DNA_ID=CAMNT_0051364003 /DNA_START=17 /DNA_END=1617 /DNA_ORIENTATION=-
MVCEDCAPTQRDLVTMKLTGFWQQEDGEMVVIEGLQVEGYMSIKDLNMEERTFRMADSTEDNSEEHMGEWNEDFTEITWDDGDVWTSRSILEVWKELQERDAEQTGKDGTRRAHSEDARAPERMATQPSAASRAASLPAQERPQTPELEVPVRDEHGKPKGHVVAKVDKQDWGSPKPPAGAPSSAARVLAPGTRPKPILKSDPFQELTRGRPIRQMAASAAALPEIPPLRRFPSVTRAGSGSRTGSENSKQIKTGSATTASPEPEAAAGRGPRSGVRSTAVTPSHSRAPSEFAAAPTDLWSLPGSDNNGSQKSSPTFRAEQEQVQALNLEFLDYVDFDYDIDMIAVPATTGIAGFWQLDDGEIVVIDGNTVEGYMEITELDPSTGQIQMVDTTEPGARAHVGTITEDFSTIMWQDGDVWTARSTLDVWQMQREKEADAAAILRSQGVSAEEKPKTILPPVRRNGSQPLQRNRSGSPGQALRARSGRPGRSEPDLGKRSPSGEIIVGPNGVPGVVLRRGQNLSRGALRGGSRSGS